jgi:CBS domain containing-hemolysin-like protein
MIKTGEREGILEEEERQLLQRTLQFADATAKEVMTPRLDISGVSADAAVEEAIETCLEAGHARLPAYGDSLDDVVGVFDIRDVDGPVSEAADRPVGEVVTPTLHVPESKNVDDLLSEMRENRLHMVIVIDEFGATEGLVTMEDVVEELVGEILMTDEDPPIEVVDDDTVLVDGSVNVEEVNEAVGVVLPEGEEFETIAGFLFNRAGRLVERGETFAYGPVTLRAEAVENHRVKRVRVSVDRDAVSPTDEAPPPDGDAPR